MQRARVAPQEPPARRVRPVIRERLVPQEPPAPRVRPVIRERLVPQEPPVQQEPQVRPVIPARPEQRERPAKHFQLPKRLRSLGLILRLRRRRMFFFRPKTVGTSRPRWCSGRLISAALFTTFKTGALLLPYLPEHTLLTPLETLRALGSPTLSLSLTVQTFFLSVSL